MLWRWTGNKNCYNCRSFGHLNRNCRNRGTEDRIGKGRKLDMEMGTIDKGR